MWRIVLILVVVAVSNLVIAVIQMVSPTLWRRHRSPVVDTAPPAADDRR
jgi:hypothetical protein